MFGIEASSRLCQETGYSMVVVTRMGLLMMVGMILGTIQTTTCAISRKEADPKTTTSCSKDGLASLGSQVCGL